MQASEHLKEKPFPLLLVDDEEIVLMALRDTLVYAGYEVVTSPHASHALSLIKERQFSVIISDHQMPVISGLEFLAEAMKTQPNATRILITAVLTINTVIEAINKGEIYRFIVKPWLRDELLATVRNAVQRFELLSTNASLQAQTQGANAKLSQLNQELEAQVAKVAEQNAQLQRLLERGKETPRQSALTALEMLRAFYPALGGKAQRVHVLCETIGKSVGLSEREHEILATSALIYDIGLIGVSRRVVKKWMEQPDALTPDERGLIHGHPAASQALAGFVNSSQEIGAIVRAHHERFDGSGYPDRLKGDSIPWLARVLSIAVAYAHSDSSPGLAVQMIRQGAGTAYDPDAVAIFLRTVPKTVPPARQREVPLSELMPGMVLAQEIVDDDGVLLIPDGECLTRTYIDKLLNYHRVHPIAESLLVYC